MRACMKTSISCSIAGLVLLANAAYAGGLEGFGVPSNMNFYGGGSVGMASENGACNATAGATNCEDSSTGYKVFAGARLNPKSDSVSSFAVQADGSVAPSSLPALGVEAGYINFGESSAEGIILSPRGIKIGDSKTSNETSGMYLSAVGYMPVAPRTELIGKAGLLYWSQDGKLDAPADPTQNESSSESGVGTLLGAGAQYQVNDNLSIRGEYEKAFGVGSDTKYESDPGLLSVGAVFSTL